MKRNSTEADASIPGRPVFLLMLFVLVSCWAIQPVAGFDIWGYMTVGRYVLSHLEIPTSDIFSFTVSGEPWINQSWLAGVLFYLAHEAFGPAGISMAVCVFFLCISGLIYSTARLYKCSSLASAAATLLAICALWKSFCPRAYVAGLAFFALFQFTLCRIVSGQGLRRLLRVALLVAVTILWVNMHASFIVGFLLIGLFAAEQTGLALLSGEASTGRPVRILWTALLLCLAASAANPAGPGLLLFPLQLIGKVQFLEQVYEWWSPGLTREFTAFWALLLVCAFSMIIAWRSLSAALVMSALIMAALALTAQRHVMWFAVAAVPVAARGFDTLWQRLDSQGAQSLGARWSRLRKFLEATAGVLFIIGTAGIIWQTSIRERLPGFGISGERLPEKAADFLEANPIRGNIFNDHTWGYYLLWRLYPDRKVFIDTRLSLYGDHWFNRYGAIYFGVPGSETLLDRLDIACAMLPWSYDLASRAIFFTSPEWRTIYWDDVAAITVRDVPENRSLIKARPFHLTCPVLFEKNLTDPNFHRPMLGELKAKLDEDPQCWLAYYNTGILLSTMGDPGAAAGAFQCARDLNPKSAASYYNLGIALAKAGDPEGAISNLEKAARLGPAIPKASLDLGMLLVGQQRNREARGWLEKALEAPAIESRARLILGTIAWQEGDADRALYHFLRALATANGPDEVRRAKKVMEPMGRVIFLEENQ